MVDENARRGKIEGGAKVKAVKRRRERKRGKELGEKTAVLAKMENEVKCKLTAFNINSKTIALAREGNRSKAERGRERSRGEPGYVPQKEKSI